MLIVFEGIDGSGKSIQSRLLTKRLSELHGKDNVMHLFEPTKKSRYGMRIRELLMKPDREASFRTELMLFVMDRKVNVNKCIVPALKKGKFIVMDRYYFSTASYQGARTSEMEKENIDYIDILKMNEEFAPIPDVLIILDIPIDEALRRIGADKSRGYTSYMEKESHLKKVQSIYTSIHESGKYQSYMLDASLSINEVGEQVFSIYKDNITVTRNMFDKCKSCCISYCSLHFGNYCGDDVIKKMVDNFIDSYNQGLAS